jgi:hypothetical protein
MRAVAPKRRQCVVRPMDSPPDCERPYELQWGSLDLFNVYIEIKTYSHTTPFGNMIHHHLFLKGYVLLRKG